MAHTPQPADPYQVLGVARAATKAQIKAAHRALAKRFHPDAATGDAQRFRDVHEAYQLLADPLRRREWDALHATGPVRADEPAKPATRRRRTAADDGSTVRPEGAARTYRWSAGEVPWWDDAARSDNRRQPDASRAPRSTADFDVYNRSSGAAWSSAARQYFRRFDAELPRHGQFRRQGSQPLTAARARVAAERDARAEAAARPVAAPPANPVAPRPSKPAHAYAAGIAHTAEQVNAARAATQRKVRAATWPTLRERLLYALLAWIPLALIVGYGGATATGCDQASVACPAWFGPAQSVAIALVLGLLVALPRLAFVGALASLALTAASVIVVAFLALYRLQPPFSSAVVLVGGSLLVGVYLLSLGVVALNRSMLPWVARR